MGADTPEVSHPERLAGAWVKKQSILLLGLAIAAAGVYLGARAGVDYNEFPLIGARNMVWLLAQTMILFAAFILAVPVFVMMIEIAGYVKQDERLDRVARDFCRLLPLSYSVTALLGGVFTFASYVLFPRFMNYMTANFKPTYGLFAGLVFVESAAVFVYWKTWDKLQGEKKKYHILIALVLNGLGTVVMMTANMWGSFHLSPAGTDAAGLVTDLRAAIFNLTFWPINIHRFIANVSFGGFICAAYGAYKYLSAVSPEERAHYDWLGYIGTLVGVISMIFLPFAGYYFGMEIYRFNAQMGITFMGGALSKIWLLQALVMAVIYLSTCYYLWLGLDRIPGSERYKRYTPYLAWVLIVAFAVWATPRAWVASLEDMAGGNHPIYGTMGIMAPKIAAVNVAILGIIVTFLISRRAGRLIPADRKIYAYLQGGVVLLVIAVNIVVLYYSYSVPSAVRIRLTIYTFLSMLPAIGLIYLFDGLLLKGVPKAEGIQWGKASIRSQYALIAAAVSNVWAMALLGYGRAAARLNWHVYGVLEDTSRHAGLPSMGDATLVISGVTLLFLVLIGAVFKFAEEGAAPREKERGGGRAALKLFIVAFVVTGLYAWFGNSIPQTAWQAPVKKAIGAEMTPRELAEIGKDIFKKAGCGVCHSVTGEKLRGSDLSRIGADMDAESMAAVLYQGTDVMPAADKPPAKLNNAEITALIAYLQSLGGRPKVRVGDIKPPS